ncbi:PREDICTED: uncharacterized protein LOC104813860 [Tarenaya hassleriana]|uniref:uncharacterized protein LOC104813860 n=1 Tax=Tarenaya hassleriana TaxID=28532 RepID=UPI00053C1A5D|nr:PREDICTED: uncharacterized protein LOC104813860 [Tarenaya hassleriana]
MDYTSVTLPTHKHPLYRSGGSRVECKGCSRGGVYNEDGYRCKMCYGDFFMHKECAESRPEIPSHQPGHPPLRLVSGMTYRNECSLCGHVIKGDVGYRCSVCDFEMDIGCALDPPSLVIENPKAHHHFISLVPDKRTYQPCHVCTELVNPYRYLCFQCGLCFHRDCSELSPELNHPSHPLHPLTLLMSKPPDYTDGKCGLCGDGFPDQRLYHCSTCKFNLDIKCAKNPPPFSFLNLKTHAHKLNLVPRHVSFTCDVCGENGDRSPYLCLQCDFMIHIECIDLPRVININRHDHRISYINPLGVTENPNRDCGVCFKKIDWSYGAYSCSVCRDYTVHSRCATSYDVWDGRELEGEFEESEDIEPFKQIDEDVIKHFSHEEHNLILNKEGIFCEENIRCNACIRPLYTDPFYHCDDCGFFLHETCANLPRKKRHVLSSERLTLVTDSKDSPKMFFCTACGKCSTGFRYEAKHHRIEVACISFSEPFKHGGHSLICNNELKNYNYPCGACGREVFIRIPANRAVNRHLGCIDTACNFVLDYKCAVLPRKENHKNDEHPLFLCYGESADIGRYWCEICEEEMNPKNWFYSCDECGTTFHTGCVAEDLASFAPGSIVTTGELKFEVIPNSHSTRPRCNVCRLRCKFLVFLKVHDDTDRYICSSSCLAIFLRSHQRNFFDFLYS